MTELVLWTAWCCATCQVGGTDKGTNPTCWNCGGEVVITGRVNKQ